MQSTNKILSTPTSVGSKFKARSRFSLSALTSYRVPGRVAGNDHHILYYVQRALSGAGLLVTEGTHPDAYGVGFSMDTPGIWTDEHVEGWKKVTSAVHEVEGAVFFAQLWHMGRASHSSFHGKLGASIAPSAIAIKGELRNADGDKVPHEVPRALSLDEIKPLIVDVFRHAAKQARKANFDGVEVHGANGYILNQFLDPSSNQREDEYGPQSFENRGRILFQVLDAVIEEIGEEHVGLKLSPNGSYNDMGSNDAHAFYTWLIGQLGKRYNLAYLCVMDGLSFGFHDKDKELTIEEIRNAYGNGTLIANCGYTLESAENVVKQGFADLVSFGRPYIPNADLPYRYENDIELNPPADASTLYTMIPNGKGYTDWPTVDPKLKVNSSL